MQDRSAPYEMLCGHCGSSAVSRDAWADWDKVSQQWIARELFDADYCHRCKGETRIVQRAIMGSVA